MHFSICINFSIIFLFILNGNFYFFLSNKVYESFIFSGIKYLIFLSLINLLKCSFVFAILLYLPKIKTRYHLIEF